MNESVGWLAMMGLAPVAMVCWMTKEAVVYSRAKVVMVEAVVIERVMPGEREVPRAEIGTFGERMIKVRLSVGGAIPAEDRVLRTSEQIYESVDVGSRVICRCRMVTKKRAVIESLERVV